MTAKTANRRSRLWNHLVRGAALALFAILVITLLGMGGITIYAVSVSTFMSGLPQPLPPAPEPAALFLYAFQFRNPPSSTGTKPRIHRLLSKLIIEYGLA